MFPPSPAVPYGLGRPPCAGQAASARPVVLRPAGLAGYPSRRERENELGGRAAGWTRAAWGIEMRLEEQRGGGDGPTLKTNEAPAVWPFSWVVVPCHSVSHRETLTQGQLLWSRLTMRD